MPIPDVEYHPAGYDYSARFQDLQLVRGFDGGSLYFATEAGRPVLVADEGTLIDMLGEMDADLVDRAISVRYFGSVAERDAYLLERIGSQEQYDRGGVSTETVTSGFPDAVQSVRSPARRQADDFKRDARARQAAFRATLPIAARTPTDGRWADYGFLLALGHEDETLYPSLRGSGGARDYFRARGARWWRSPTTGDSNSEGPTRNLTSSQVACVNMFLPFQEESSLLAAMLRAIDPSIVTVARIDCRGASGQPLSSYVELEWTGRLGTLEGSGSRGANATSADACLIGVTANGERRAFLIELKYTESYPTGVCKGEGQKGDERRARYEQRYDSPSSCFSRAASLDDVLYDPFYQIVRLGLLGDAMCEDEELDLADARVVVVCPMANTAYRERITSPPLQRLFPEATTVMDVARRLWKRPEMFSMIDQSQLVEAVQADSTSSSWETWSRYMRERYDW